MLGRIILFLCILFAVVGSFLSPPPAQAHAKKLTAEMLQPLIAARLACDTADDTMHAQMQRAAAQFSHFSRQLRRFPRAQSEYVAARDSLQSSIQANPYTKNPLLAKELETLPADIFGTTAGIAILPDADLTEAKVEYLRETPDESWQAYPGSIGILHNQDDLFIVWGAGIDGKPLHDKDGNLFLIVVRPFGA